MQVCSRVCPPSPTPPPPQNSSDLRESHDPTRLGQGGHLPTRAHRGYATDAQSLNLKFLKLSN